jgi:hypothetical protein
VTPHVLARQDMKWVPIALPTPREPECSMSQTAFSLSKQTLTKWVADVFPD